MTLKTQGHSEVKMSSSACRRLLSKCTAPQLARLFGAEASELKKTPLYDFHVSRGGKMVPFAGWSMPLVYDDLSISKSTLHTRKLVSLFDVSHMSQLALSGPDAERLLEHSTVADARKLSNGSATLSMFTNARGGIIDDCIVTRDGPDSFYIVANASRKNEVIQQLQVENERKSFDAIIVPLIERSLVALQGPLMASVLQRGLAMDLSTLFFMHSAVTTVFDIPDCRVSRCGYTGEDGVEISVGSEDTVKLVERIMDAEEVSLAGLGARDALRLEAGLCLYGNDISEDVTPVEAGLTWCITKRRRKEGGFVGDDIILNQVKDKPNKKRIGLISEGPPARSGAAVLTAEGEKVGEVTSGCFSPTLQRNISMAYVPQDLSKVGTKVDINIRKKTFPAVATKMPFVGTNYYTN